MKTAVEWLCEKYHLKKDIEIVKEAIEMEKQQIVDAYDVLWVEHIKNGEDYYNETFKK